MKLTMSIASLVILSIFLLGCAPKHTLGDLEPDKSYKAEVIDLLGQPVNQRSTAKYDYFEYVFIRPLPESPGMAKQLILSIRFEDDRMIDYEIDVQTVRQNLPDMQQPPRRPSPGGPGARPFPPRRY